MTPKTLTLPILPLPDTAFFPHTLLPLHIFEPRYKSLVHDALENNSMIGVVQLKPGWHDNYFEAPPIYKVLGVGTVLESDRLDDGRYDIILSGLYRTRIIQENEHTTYRTAEVEVIEDIISPETGHSINDVHDILIKIYQKISHALPTGMSLHPDMNLEDVSPGVLVDVMSSLLVDDPYERQSLLSEPDVARRQQLLRIQIKKMFNPLPTGDDQD